MSNSPELRPERQQDREELRTSIFEQRTTDEKQEATRHQAPNEQDSNGGVRLGVSKPRTLPKRDTHEVHERIRTEKDTFAAD